ncbi:MAG: ATP-binding cassette domain-containing protein [Solirubrobacterales bacterium]|nr:ATP-binding cassette domain-containing protein [Solirubrobacterales bacterium]
MEAQAEMIVRCVDLRRRYGEGEAAVDALAGVTLDFPRGELTSIVGPSGSGKSTLMHVLAGLDRPTGGQVWVDGSEITALEDAELTRLRRDKLGFIFQFFNLVPVLSAEENVTLPLRIAGRDVDDGWLETLLDTVGIADRRTHRPAELSGGQQQRVAIARALISKPAVVFADEPTGNLDSTSSTHVLELLRRSVDELGHTVIMVTHDPRVAAYADRVVLLVDGGVSSDTSVASAEQVHELMQTA